MLNNMSDEDRKKLYDYLQKKKNDEAIDNLDWSGPVPVERESVAQVQPPSLKPPQTAQDILGPDYDDAARKKMTDEANKPKLGNIVGDAFAGLGDSLARSYGGDAGAHHLQDALSMEEKDKQRKIDQFNQGREGKIQDFTLGQKAKEEADKTALEDPMSAQSKRYQKAAAPVLRLAGFTDEDIANIPGAHVDSLTKNATSIADVKMRAEALKNEKHLTFANREDQQQDRLEQQARQGLQSIRGDSSLKNIEAQRDAAIVAYNRIKQVESQGKELNPIDYVDILGQIYKARTGSAPTESILKEANQQTAKGKLGKVYTFFTGNQAPATSQEIMKSLKEMAYHMGTQADQLHGSYMQTHGKDAFPSGLAKDRAERLSKLERGMSFAEATGSDNEQQGTDTNIPSFQGEKDAEAANLPPGTVILIGGRKARVK